MEQDKRAKTAAKRYRQECKAKGLRLLAPYVTALTKVPHKCLKCGNEFEIKPNDVRTRKPGFNGCMACRRVKQKAWHAPFDDYKARIEARGLVKVIGDGPVREGTNGARIKCKCLTCPSVFTARRQDLINGHGCKDCGFKRAQAAFKTKPFKLGRRTVGIQGYEAHALTLLLEHGVRPNDICVTQDAETPIIRMKDGTKHYPDVYIRSRKVIIEVKSVWTVGMLKNPSDTRSQTNKYNRVRQKAREAIEQGFDYRLWVMHSDGSRLKTPKEWTSMTRHQFRKAVLEMNPDLRLQKGR